MSSPKKNKTEKRLETLAVKTKKQKQAFLEQLPKYPIVQVACEKSGVGRSTYYAWRKDDKEFAKLADEAITSGTFFINDMAESKLIQNIQSGNNTAIIFWLKNHHDSYNERIIHEHVVAEEEITEEKKAMVKALINIGFTNILKSYGMTPEEYRKQKDKEYEDRLNELRAEEERKNKKEEAQEQSDSLPQVVPKHKERMVNIAEALKKMRLEKEKKLTEQVPPSRPLKKGANINDILRKRKRPDAL